MLLSSKPVYLCLLHPHADYKQRNISTLHQVFTSSKKTTHGNWYRGGGGGDLMNNQ